MIFFEDDNILTLNAKLKLNLKIPLCKFTIVYSNTFDGSDEIYEKVKHNLYNSMMFICLLEIMYFSRSRD